MITVAVFVILAIIAVGIGFLASLFGIGGGFLLYPAMIFIAGLSVHYTVGTIPLVIMFMAFSSTLAYARQRRIDYLVTSIIIGVSILGSILGACTAVQVPGTALVIMFGVVELILASILGLKKTSEEEPVPDFSASQREIGGETEKKWYILPRQKVDSYGNEFHYKANILFALPLGFLAGFLSSLLGIGGGSLYIQIFVFLCGMGIHMAIACSIFAIFISTISSTITFAALGVVDYTVGLAIIIGMIIGAQIGAIAARKIKSGYLRPMAAIMIIIIAIQMIVFALVGKPV